jgi:hypothetical protein
MTMQLQTSRCSRAISSALAAAVTLVSPQAIADEFALSASPPRFELATKPGVTVRDVAELSNASPMAATFTFATADWDLNPSGGINLHNELTPGSCRPWVAIERNQVTLMPKSRLRYRFEVSPPIDAAPTECRFAILVKGGEERVAPSKETSFPVSAQIALIVYVAVGNVKPEITIVKADVVPIGGVQTPVLMVKNTGTAHGRLSTQLSGTDAAGKKREFSASTLPILPGETRMIALNDYRLAPVGSLREAEAILTGAV